MNSSTSNVDVQSILRKIISSSTVSLPSSSLLPNTTASSSSQFNAANYEANQGLKGEPQNPRANPGGKKKKQQSLSEFKVAYIVWIVHGLRKDKAGRVTGLINDSVPTSHERQNLPRALLYDSSVTGINLSSAWSHEEVLAALRQFFPQMFQYFDLLPSPPGQPHFVLCARFRKCLHVISDSTPNGKRLWDNRGTFKGRWSDHQIFLATCDPVPQKILALWSQLSSETPAAPGHLVFNLNPLLKQKGKGRAISQGFDSDISNTAGSDGETSSSGSDSDHRSHKRHCGAERLWTRSTSEPLFLSNDIPGDIPSDCEITDAKPEPDLISSPEISFLRPRKASSRTVFDLTDSTDDDQDLGEGKSNSKPILTSDLSFSNDKPVSTLPSNHKFEDF